MSTVPKNAYKCVGASIKIDCSQHVACKIRNKLRHVALPNVSQFIRGWRIRSLS